MRKATAEQHRIPGLGKPRRIFRDAGKHEETHEAHGLHLWFEADVIAKGKMDSIVASLSKSSTVQKAQKRPGQHKMQGGGPNDPLLSSQTHHQAVTIEAAWGVARCNTPVIIGMADSGLDTSNVDHQDLWQNPGEAGNCDNGVDDDGNGFVDDCNGWVSPAAAPSHARRPPARQPAGPCPTHPMARTCVANPHTLPTELRPQRGRRFARRRLPRHALRRHRCRGLERRRGHRGRRQGMRQAHDYGAPSERAEPAISCPARSVAGRGADSSRLVAAPASP